MDLHRLAGHSAGHVRDVRRGRAHALRRLARRPLRAHRGTRRHGRRAAARRDDERRRDPRHRRRRVAHRQAPRDRLLRPQDRTSLDEALALDSRGDGREARAVGRTRRQRRRDPAGAGAPRRDARRADRSDERARHAERLRARRAVARRGGGACARRDPTEYVARANASIVAHVRAMLAMQQRGAVTFDYGNNIRTVALDNGVADAFDIPGFVPEYVRPLFCEGKGPFRWVALSGDPQRSRAHRRAGARAVPARRAPAALDHAGARARPLPGIAGAHLLARAGRARAVRRRAQRSRGQRRALGADRHRPRPSRHRQRGVAVPRDRSDDATAATRSPIGRFSTRCSTRRAARRGCRSTTAAASASATRCTPAR